MKDKSSVPRCTHGSRAARVVHSTQKQLRLPVRRGYVVELPEFVRRLSNAIRVATLPIMAQSIDYFRGSK